MQPQTSQELVSFILNDGCPGNSSSDGDHVTCGRTYSPQVSPRHDVTSSSSSSSADEMSSVDAESPSTHTLDEILNLQEATSYRGT